MKEHKAVLNAVLRNDFESFLQRCLATLNPGSPYLPNWHISAIAYQLERVRRGEINRLIINMPPRHLKSLTVTVAFTAYVLGHDPTQRIYAICYGSELALKHARDFRAVVESGWYPSVFPRMMIIRGTDDDVMTCCDTTATTSVIALAWPPSRALGEKLPAMGRRATMEAVMSKTNRQQPNLATLSL